MRPESSNSLDIGDLYAPFRENISALATDDALYAIWAYAQKLQLTAFKFPKDIEVAVAFLEHAVPRSWISEWELLVLAKEVIINSKDVGPSLRNWATLSSIMNAIKELENSIYRRYGSAKNVLIEMNRIAHRQFTWQVDYPNLSSFARYLVLFDTAEIDQISRDRTGVPVRAIFQYGLMLYGGFMESREVIIPPQGPGVDQDLFEKFLGFTARTRIELSELLRSEQTFNSSYAYAYNSLHAYPLIKTRRDQTELLWCPLPTLLFWRMTKGLYYSLMEDPRFGDHLGRSFQNYVGESIVRAIRPPDDKLLREVRYGAKAVARDSVDWILLGERCALFIECKAKRLSWKAKQSLDDITSLLDDVRNLASAVVQTYRNFVDYRDNKYPHLPFDSERDVLLLIVTLENWFILGPRLRALLHAAVVEKLTEAHLSPSLLDQIPFSIVPISELESGMEISREVGLQEFWWGKLTHPEMFEWDWRSYILTEYASFEITNLFERELDELTLVGTAQ
jgi:hypothetical protein